MVVILRPRDLAAIWPLNCGYYQSKNVLSFFNFINGNEITAVSRRIDVFWNI